MNYILIILSYLTTLIITVLLLTIILIILKNNNLEHSKNTLSYQILYREFNLILKLDS